jgi:hypothetical protein
MPDGNFYLKVLEIIAKRIPFAKLNKHYVANLTFDIAALVTTLSFTTHSIRDEILAVFLWIFTLVMSFACFLWASTY